MTDSANSPRASRFGEPAFQPRQETLTPAQRRELLRMHEHGFTAKPTSYRGMPRNRPLWALVEMGLAEFGWGPRGSWLTTYGFSPTWTDPVV